MGVTGRAIWGQLDKVFLLLWCWKVEGLVLISWCAVTPLSTIVQEDWFSRPGAQPRWDKGRDRKGDHLWSTFEMDSLYYIIAFRVKQNPGNACSICARQSVCVYVMDKQENKCNVQKWFSVCWSYILCYVKALKKLPLEHKHSEILTVEDRLSFSQV